MEIVKQAIDPDIITSLVLEGDLSKMSPQRRTEYYKQFCDALGLNPLTQPFQILKLNGKEKMYATKDCTEQLRKIHGVSIISISAQEIRGVFVVTANAEDCEKRTDSATGAVTIDKLTGDALANALMKAETKAKRRVTLSICGLGMLDETELETIPGAKTVPIVEDAKQVEAKPADVLPPSENIEKGPDINELNSTFIDLLNQYGSFVGMPKALTYHPDNWKVREVKNYIQAIKEIKSRIKQEEQNHFKPA